ncbi:MAG TPA: TetR/AcrR family transcriptional regulator [Acidiferrobacteraceae bacterium]|nr:TetR/AcrR family transcriptional regulator [Acidiferrobacteraceae bacterium]
MENTAIRIGDTRCQIVAAAEARFRTYGFTKTTMAEIAEDVGMSAANLYRYFENKQDIAAVCANRCMSEQIDVLRDVTQQPGLAAGERLVSFVLAMLRYTHEQASEHPKIDELVQIIAKEHQQLVHDKNMAIRELIAEILVQGNDSGEFDVADAEDTAHAIYSAIALFGIPLFMPLYSLGEFELRVKSVVKLLIRGLAKVRE